MSPWTTPGAKRALGANAGGGRAAEMMHSHVHSFSASRINGTNPFDGVLGLYEQMLADKPPTPSAAQIRAADAMPRLIRHFEALHENIATRRVGVLVSREHSTWLAARPTCLTSDGGILIVTVTRDDFADEWHSPSQPEHRRMPARMTSRVLHDLMVTGVTHAYVLCEIQGRDTNEIVLRSMHRDELGTEAEMRELFQLEHQFYLRHVQARRAPEPNVGDMDLLTERLRTSRKGHTVVATAQHARHVARWHELEADIQRMQEQVTALKVAIKSAMGNAEVLLAKDGVTRLIDWKQTRAFRARDFEQDHPGTAADYLIEQTVQVLDVDSLASALPTLTRQYYVRPLCRVRSHAARAALDRVS